MFRTSMVLCALVCGGCFNSASPTSVASDEKSGPYPECPVVLDWINKDLERAQLVDRQTFKDAEIRYVFLQVDEWGKRSEGRDNYSSDPHVHIWVTYSYEVIRDGKRMPQAQVKGRVDMFRNKVTDFTPWG